MVPPKAVGTLLAEDVYLRAITVGRGAAGLSGPNPPVGCVIVRDGRIVGEGATAAVGGPHAEIVALGAAGDRASGAVAVVTLEPCAHRGRTGPCTDALIASGVTEVHLLLRDPDPMAAGGVDRLRAAGLQVVEVGPRFPALAEMVAHDLRGFIARVRLGRPHVTLKLAQAVDGRTDPAPSRYLTGPAARRRVHELRSSVDAVLVGSGTVRADDPQLDVRHVGSEDGARPEDGRPRPVILATTAEVDPGARVVSRGALVLVGDDAPDGRCTALVDAGATVVRVAHAPARAGLDLGAALGALLDHRILTVLAEPGPTLADALLAGGLVDDVELHIAGVVTPDTVVPALARLAPMIDAWRSAAGDVDRGGAEVSSEELDGDVILRLRSAGPRSVVARRVAEVA